MSTPAAHTGCLDLLGNNLWSKYSDSMGDRRKGTLTPSPSANQSSRHRLSVVLVPQLVLGAVKDWGGLEESARAAPILAWLCNQCGRGEL